MKEISPKIKTWLYPVLAAPCLFLGFEKYNFFPILFLMPFFLNGMRTLPMKQKLLSFGLFALATNVGGYHWIRLVSQDYGGLPAIPAWGIVLLFSSLNNISYVLWGYLERFFDENDNPFVIAALFSVVEQLNPQVFPWHFGTCLDSVPVLYQTADIFGVIGLSFLAMSLIHLPWWLWRHRTELLGDKKWALTGQAAVWSFVVIYGVVMLGKYGNEPGRDRKSVNITLMQANTVMEKYYGAHRDANTRFLEFLELVEDTKKAAAGHKDGVDLIVWPEGGVHFTILNNPRILTPIQEMARQFETYVTAGSAEIGSKDSNGRRKYYNTQFVLDRQGNVMGKYRKIVLLAFGEYIPFSDTFPVIRTWLPETISNFSRGTEKPIFPIGDEVNWLPLICYEDLMPEFIRGFDHHRADLFVNMTNDGWFGKSHASHLHKQMARARAVEYRKPMVRTLNTGTSLVIDAAGRTITRETDLYVRDHINVTLNLPEKPPVTIFSIIGNTPIYLLMVTVAGLWLRRRFKR